MAGFDFNKLDSFVQQSNNSDKINFLSLKDDGWYAKVRFMYGPNESIRFEAVHNISDNSKKPKYTMCLREEGQPIEACPLCANGYKSKAQFYLPVYVQSIVSVINGIEQEQPIGQVMIFQRGATFKSMLQSILRVTHSTGKPIVSSLFRLVRSGKKDSQDTSYMVEYMGTDDVTLEQLPPKPEVVGSYILPKLTAEEMIAKYINKQAPQASPVTATATNTGAYVNGGIQPRTVNMNTFAGNSVGFGQPTQNTVTVNETTTTNINANANATTSTFNQPMNNANQAPNQAPTIGSGSGANTVSTGNVPF